MGSRILVPYPFLGHPMEAAPTSRSQLAALAPAIAITSMVRSAGWEGTWSANHKASSTGFCT